MASALSELHHLALRGEVAGAVLAWEDVAGNQTAILCGEFEADKLRAREAAGRLYETVEDLAS
jgi:hypothetical protein